MNVAQKKEKVPRTKRRTIRNTRAVKPAPFPLSHFDPYAHSDAASVINEIKHRNSKQWERVGQDHALALFQAAARRVPAYRDFLKKNKFDPSKVTSFELLAHVPILTKKNYVNQYPLRALTWDGVLTHPSVFTSTSGSTGEPTYFFRSDTVDWQCSIIQELFFANAKAPQKPTLVVVCFGMGIWIGGIITYEAITQMAARGYPVSIITPGINKTEIFKALKRLAPQYEQTVIFGYPPFIKDLIDESRLAGVDIAKLNLRFSTAAETFSEGFREHIAKVSAMRDPVLDVSSVYGSADIGAMAFETPSSIAIRRIAKHDEHVFRDLFHTTEKTPTLARFVPSFINFEEHDAELILTGNSAIPLIRYAIGDIGGVYSHDQVEEILTDHGHTMPRVIDDHFRTSELPYVYIFERNDFSTTLYGAQIYPEVIKDVLIKRPFSRSLSGKFTLVTRYDEKHNQYLEINLEIGKKKQVSSVLRAHLQNQIIKALITRNSEFRELHKFIGERSHPKLVFWDSEDPQFFRPGVKQRWVK